ncbi:uncharacterized protein LAESUDRAFT_186534 [Laetiporus sulphureus 93-53]|uniref:Uncharacterized protein n=1 Tax=Laetiporus sulphureus 93-53 TaxID=1314785 RepID=A0A165E569_9APHY|nr:uncharacterized protein LAESUDRAFT_186534 [Laetiporus sulphureus 93-53]KZT06257.1 hypothetical protein LAESUDRAFT_186534 [Laetiporus sulphureus 93-53]
MQFSNVSDAFIVGDDSSVVSRPLFLVSSSHKVQSARYGEPGKIAAHYTIADTRWIATHLGSGHRWSSDLRLPDAASSLRRLSCVKKRGNVTFPPCLNGLSLCYLPSVAPYLSTLRRISLAALFARAITELSCRRRGLTPSLLLWFLQRICSQLVLCPSAHNLEPWSSMRF